MQAATYHADPCRDPSLSSSIAQILLRESPLKAWFSHPRLNSELEEHVDDKFDLGTAAHAALLEGSDGIAVIDPADYPSKTGNIPDGWTNNAIREARDSARALGKTPLLKRHYDGVRRMVEVANEFISASEIGEDWRDGDSEVTAIWSEGKPPIWMRCRMDRIAKDRRLIVDYKSTVDASPEQFSRLLVRMGYHIQDSFYRRGARAVGVDEPRFVFLAQSVEPPYECSLHGCDPALQQIADAEVDRAVRLWRHCLATAHWPSYDKRVHYAIPTSYMIQDHEMRLQEAA